MGDFHLDIDGLAPMIFLKNPRNLPIRVQLNDPIKNQKDLFFFLLDLFFKGIYYISVGHYGNCQVVRLSEMTLDTVFSAIRKLKNIDVKVTLSVSEKEVFEQTKVRHLLKESISVAKSCPEDMDLNRFMVLVPINDSVYELRFEMHSQLRSQGLPDRKV